MIKYDNEWKQTSSISLKYSTFTLAEFLELVKRNVPKDTKDEDICLDFQIEDYDDYNLYGEKIYTISAELEVSTKK